MRTPVPVWVDELYGLKREQVSPGRISLSELSHFVTSMTAPIASGWSNIGGWISHPLEKAALI